MRALSSVISFLCLHMVENEHTYALALCCKGTNLTMKASVLRNLAKPNYLPYVSFPRSTAVGIKASAWE